MEEEVKKDERWKRLDPDVLTEMGIPPRYQPMIFEGMETKTPAEVAVLEQLKNLDVEDYCNNGRDLILYGGIGSGKTRVLSIYAREAFVNLNLDVRVVSYYRLHDLEVEPLQNCDFLVIDDLFEEMIAVQNHKTFFAVIDFRVRNKKATFVGTDIPPEKFVEYVGTDIAACLLERSEIVRLPFGNMFLRNSKNWDEIAKKYPKITSTE